MVFQLHRKPLNGVPRNSRSHMESPPEDRESRVLHQQYPHEHDPRVQREDGPHVRSATRSC